MSSIWETILHHWMTLPVLVPLLGGFLVPLVGRDRSDLRRTLTFVVLLATFGAGLHAIDRVVATGAIFKYEVSGWAAPFGIALMVDRLSAALVTMTPVIGLGAHLYAIFGDDERDAFFHSLLLVQIAGLNGAFLTGDLFNLFVFFEVLLIASYNLLVYGGGEGRTRAGIHYVVLNLIGSALFLASVGLLYALTGTLNMADMALRIGQLPQADAALARSAATLLTIVFGIKAALVPLYFWLPRAYGNATAPVAAIFAVMTKVGIYAILRTSTLIFGDGAGVASNITDGWLLPLALVTMVLGALGVAAARRLQVLVAYLVVVSVGTILAPIAVGTTDAIASALYYLIHSTVISATLFLVADLVARKRGEWGDSIVDGPGIAQPTWLALTFFAGAIVVVGLPPSSGFIGKVLVLESVVDHPQIAWIWGAVLGTSLLSLIVLARAGSRLFWRTEEGAAEAPLPGVGRAMAPILLLGAVAVWTAFAGPAQTYLRKAAVQLLDRDAYIQAIDPQDYDPSAYEKHSKEDAHH